MQRSNKAPKTARWSLLAVAALIGSLVLGAALPAAAETPTSGVWIFPHAKRTDAVADDLDDSFYTADSENPWLQDSFFADAQSDGATVVVDLYNPTSTDLYNVQIFAAYPIEDLDLVESIAFGGGEAGDLAYSGTDLESGGTPTLPGGGASMDPHDIYATYFVSYGFGDLPAGASVIGSFTIDIAGDFASGLLIHLDYTAEDADGSPVQGPFEADMNIFDNGESEEPPACDPSSLKLEGSVGKGEYKPGSGVDIDATLSVTEDFRYEKSEVRATLSTGSLVTVVSATRGTVTEGAWSWDITQGQGPINLSANLSLHAAPLLLAGDIHTMSATVSWEDCDGDHSASILLSSTVASDATGEVHSAAWWTDQLANTDKAKSKAAYNRTQADGLLQAIAAHSDIFTYGAWNGTAPSGGNDEGWLDLGSLDDAREVLKGKTGDSKKVRGAERQALALWLNVASGALNLDSPLKVLEKEGHGKAAKTEFEAHTGLSSLSKDFDTPAEVLSNLESEVVEWQDGSGASKADLKLARRLAKAVNNGWLVLA